MPRAMPLTTAVCCMAVGAGTRKPSGRPTQPEQNLGIATQQIRRVQTAEVSQQLVDRLQAISSQLSTLTAVVQDIAASEAQGTVPPVLSPRLLAASRDRFVSDSSKIGHAVFCFDLPPHPFIFIRNINARQWRELHKDSTVLEASAISLTLEHLLSRRDM